MLDKKYDQCAASAPCRLAIVIPAWKSDYISAAVDSILQQSCADFHLYIGDDASPNRIAEVLGARLKDKRITYHQFSENIGRTDLVAQWERCIDLVGDEEWIWLFSDDDLMDKCCVEVLQKQFEASIDADLLRFPVSCIDANGNVVREFVFRQPPTPKAFLELRWRNEMDSFVVEYVFRKSAFIKRGRFQKFDLAWGADDATWMKMMEKRPPLYLPQGRVFWRKSGLNISSNEKDEKLATRKVKARLGFLRWSFERYAEAVESHRCQRDSRRWFFRNVEIRAFPVRKLISLSKEAYAEMKWPFPGYLGSSVALIFRKYLDELGLLLVKCVKKGARQ